MTERAFTDSTGRQWRVWDVHPDREVAALGNPERRARPDRRGDPAPDPVIERRHLSERRRRRQAMQPSLRIIRPELRGGWLCFDVDGQPGARRRLSPIPADWPQCTDAELEAYLRQAASSEQSPSDPPRSRPGDSTARP